MLTPTIDLGPISNSLEMDDIPFNILPPGAGDLVHLAGSHRRSLTFQGGIAVNLELTQEPLCSRIALRRALLLRPRWGRLDNLAGLAGLAAACDCHERQEI